MLDTFVYAIRINVAESKKTSGRPISLRVVMSLE